MLVISLLFKNYFVSLIQRFTVDLCLCVCIYYVLRTSWRERELWLFLMVQFVIYSSRGPDYKWCRLETVCSDLYVLVVCIDKTWEFSVGKSQRLGVKVVKIRICYFCYLKVTKSTRKSRWNLNIYMTVLLLMTYRTIWIVLRSTEPR